MTVLVGPEPKDDGWMMLDDVGGSTTRGCGGCCDGGSDVEKGVTLIKTRLLRKG